MKVKAGDISPNFVEKMCIKYGCGNCPLYYVNCAIYQEFTDKDLNVDVTLNNEEDIKLFNEKEGNPRLKALKIK